MRTAKVTLCVAIAILLCGYIVAAFLVPRMPRLGFEGVLVLGGAVGVISFVVGAVLAARAGIIALRESHAERTIGGYATLILSALVSLAVATILVVAFIQP